MSDFIIGNTLDNLEIAEVEKDLYKGLAKLEKEYPSLIVFNLDDQVYKQNDFSRIFKLLDHKKIPTIFISNHGGLKEYESRDYMKIIPKNLVEDLWDDYLGLLDKTRAIDKKIIEISKQKRTLPFYILGAILLFEPFIKVLYLKFITGFDFFVIFDVIFSIEGAFSNFEFWLLFPLAGIALIRPMAISLFVFLAINIYSLIANFTYQEFTWPYVQATPHISSKLLLFFNLSLLCYFIIPENRKPFVNKTKKFFRLFDRVENGQEVLLTKGSKTIFATFMDMSESGVMLSSSVKLSLEDEVCFEFSMLGRSETFHAKVIRQIEGSEDNPYIYGLKFTKLNSVHKMILEDYVSYKKQKYMQVA